MLKVDASTRIVRFLFVDKQKAKVIDLESGDR